MMVVSIDQWSVSIIHLEPTKTRLDILALVVTERYSLITDLSALSSNSLLNFELVNLWSTKMDWHKTRHWLKLCFSLKPLTKLTHFVNIGPNNVVTLHVQQTNVIN